MRAVLTHLLERIALPDEIDDNSNRYPQETDDGHEQRDPRPAWQTPPKRPFKTPSAGELQNRISDKTN